VAKHRKNTVDRETQLEKNKLISQSMSENRLRRKTQECTVVTLKIQTNKLNTKQKEETKMLFIEAKWIKNEMLNYSASGNNIFEYECGDTIQVKNKDKEFEQRERKYISVQQIQSVIEEVKNNIRSLSAL
jgi:predicted enzyme involved in methoxymalonyl-ACP biosynthesis